MNLRITPVSLKASNQFVAEHHRHHRPVVGHKFSVGVSDGDRLCGVAIVGRPVSRYFDDGLTLEITRCCTDGTRNACSFLYGAASRVAKEMGYSSIITYTLESEKGTSLRAAGFENEGRAGGLEWTGKRKPRDSEQYPHEYKIRWRKVLMK